MTEPRDYFIHRNSKCINLKHVVSIEDESGEILLTEDLPDGGFTYKGTFKYKSAVYTVDGRRHLFDISARDIGKSIKDAYRKDDNVMIFLKPRD